MDIYRFHPLIGDYEVKIAPLLDVTGTTQVMTGVCRIAAGRRSPEQGFRQGCRHEVDYVIKGRLRVDTAERSWEVVAGDTLVASPDAPHATTALEDSEIFFVLMDPIIRF